MHEALSDGVKLAVIECVPTDSAASVSTAWPELSGSLLPSTVVPSLNMTVPAWHSEGVAVAVKVTVSPKVDGFADDFSKVVVAALSTV
jgi:hypothetical protein